MQNQFTNLRKNIKACSQNMAKSSLFQIAKLSFNFNLNLVEGWDGLTLDFSNHPPDRKITRLIISAITIPIWPNIKGRFLVLSWADSNCQGNIFQATVAWQQLSISGISYLLLIRSNQTILWTRICLNYTHCTKLVFKLIMKRK